MEFVKTAEDVLYDDGELVMEDVVDNDGVAVQGPTGVMTRPKPDPKGSYVLTSKETVSKVEARHITEALKAAKGTVEHLSITAGGNVVVRIRRKK